MRLRFIAILFLLIAGIASATIPTLETDAGAATLRITDGTSGNPVTWDDVWAFGAGGGAGLVPIDGGGTARVDTFMTEIVADAMYTIQKDIDFGDGATSTYFQSTNEMVYFEDGIVSEVQSNATLQMGKLEGDYGYNGSTWSYGQAANLSFVQVGGTARIYGSTINLRTNQRITILGLGDGIELVSTVFNGIGGGTQILQFGSNVSLVMRRFTLQNAGRLEFAENPALAEEVFIHFCIKSIFANNSSLITTPVITSFTISDYNTFGAITLTAQDPLFNVQTPSNQDAAGIIIEQYTSQIHVTDKSGADIEGVDVDITYAHLVEGSDSKTYKCIQDHTAVDATHKPITGNDWESFWELYDADGGLGGDWDTGFDYKADAAEFTTGQTDENGDLRGGEQIVDGDFNDDENWDLGVGWSIANNKASQDNNASLLSQELGGGNTVIGESYRVKFLMLDYIAGDLTAFFGGDEIGDQSADGLFTTLAVAVGTTESIEFSSDSEFIGSITDVSVRQAVMNIQYKKWVGTSEILEARIHKFTYTIAGYKPLIMQDVIVDHPLVWEIEMPEAVGPFGGAWK